MKRNLLVLLLALMTSMPMLADVVINETNFPDANFRNYLLTNEDPTVLPTNQIKNDKAGINGYGKDGKLTDDELRNINSITLENVANLEGIELLPYLTYLKCTGITTEMVDLSANGGLMCLELQGSFEDVILIGLLNLWGLKLDAPLTSLDLSDQRYLEYIQLKNTNLSSIDLSRIDLGLVYSQAHVGIYNPQREFVFTPPSITFDLTISNSKQTNLDFSGFNMMNGLFLMDNNDLTSLILPTNKTDLVDLVLHNNPLLTSLNVSDYTNLQGLSYRSNGFKSVDVSENDSLRFLECYGNGLTSLDVSSNKVLNHLFCQDNLLTSLDLSNNTDLRSLECYNNQLTELDLSNNPYLRTEAIEKRTSSRASFYPRWRSFPDNYYSYGCLSTTFSNGIFFRMSLGASQFGEVIMLTSPSIILSPQNTNKDFIAIDGRSKLGVQCNTNDGVLTSYGTYTAVTSSDDDNNYIVVGDGTTDVHGYNSPLSYNYNTGYTGDYDAAKTMEVNIGTSAHGMYVHPETLRGSDNFYSGTLYLEFPARIPDGVQCYYATALDDNEDLVGLTEVTGTIPAHTAVIVKAPSEYKFFAFNESEDTPDAPTDNIIQGIIEGLSVTPGTVLTLGHNVDRSTGEYDKFGFWDYRGSKISPFRAYIPKSNLTAGAKSGFSLVFPEDNTTGIARLTNDSAVQDGTWYTLSGVRLNGKPTEKGIYVNNGKKIVIR